MIFVRGEMRLRQREPRNADLVFFRSVEEKQRQHSPTSARGAEELMKNVAQRRVWWADGFAAKSIRILCKLQHRLLDNNAQRAIEGEKVSVNPRCPDDSGRPVESSGP
jgi:hypothetical protein